MSRDERRIYDKDRPSAEGRTFIPMPTNALHYVNHPDMRPNMLLLYAILIDKYNVEKGYAYPSLETLSVAYGMSYNVTSAHVETLKDVGLIDYPEKGYYVPLEPLSADEFYRTYPEAWQAYEKALGQAEGKRKNDRERLREWRASRFGDDGEEGSGV